MMFDPMKLLKKILEQALSLGYHLKLPGFDHWLLMIDH